jgi:hypothetical protein
VCLAAPVRERFDRGPWPIACCLEPKSEFSHPARPDLTAWVVALWCCSDGLVITLVLLPAVLYRPCLAAVDFRESSVEDHSHPEPTSGVARGDQGRMAGGADGWRSVERGTGMAGAGMTDAAGPTRITRSASIPV